MQKTETKKKKNSQKSVCLLYTQNFSIIFVFFRKHKASTRLKTFLAGQVISLPLYYHYSFYHFYGQCGKYSLRYHLVVAEEKEGLFCQSRRRLRRRRSQHGKIISVVCLFRGGAIWQHFLSFNFFFKETVVFVLLVKTPQSCVTN